MTPRQWKSLGRYVRQIGDAMWLRDWTFDINHNPSDGDMLAAVECTYGRKIATLQFCPNWPNLDPELQRHAIVHELLHVHMSGARNLVYHTLPSLLGEAAWSAFESAFRQNDEMATDGLADAFASLFPLWEG